MMIIIMVFTRGVFRKLQAHCLPQVAQWEVPVALQLDRLKVGMIDLDHPLNVLARTTSTLLI